MSHVTWKKLSPLIKFERTGYAETHLSLACQLIHPCNQIDGPSYCQKSGWTLFLSPPSSPPLLDRNRRRHVFPGNWWWHPCVQIVENTRGGSQTDIGADKALAPQRDASYASFGLHDWAPTSKMVSWRVPSLPCSNGWAIAPPPPLTNLTD
jgi:hypothetical protein